MVADVVYFNSEWNRSSFLDSIPAFINRSPDKEPKGVAEKIRAKSHVLYFPVQINHPISLSVNSTESPLHILWNHRWEYDKDPDTFFSVLFELDEHHIPFHVSVLGESYEETPPIFATAKERLASHIINFGFAESKEAYYAILEKTDVCVSTAIHEFFGVSVIEAEAFGNYCLCPNRLS